MNRYMASSYDMSATYPLCDLVVLLVYFPSLEIPAHR